MKKKRVYNTKVTPRSRSYENTMKGVKATDIKLFKAIKKKIVSELITYTENQATLRRRIAANLLQHRKDENDLHKKLQKVCLHNEETREIGPKSVGDFYYCRHCCNLQIKPKQTMADYLKVAKKNK